LKTTDRRSDGNPPRPRRFRRLAAALVAMLAVGALGAAGCAKYNTFYNAEKAFAEAERAREEALKAGEDPGRAATAQKQNYQRAIAKAQKLLDEYPGHSLTDDALFLQGKAYNRLASYRMSIRQLDLMFANFPQTPFLEEGVFLQAVNYLMLGDAGHSQDLLDRLERQFPDSRFQSEALRASGDNAYALRNWEDAVAAYERFLTRYPKAQDWDSSSQRLAEALWELERYAEAIPVLERIVDESPLADRVFRARLLLARCLVRTGEQAEVEGMLPGLKTEAEIYGKPGEVALVEAENLAARGDVAAALALLEGLAEDQLSREVKPLRADMIARFYLAQPGLETTNLEKARDSFQQAVGGGELIEEPEDSRILLDTIKEYLAADSQLPDAQPDRAARLRLLQANALLFGFERPRAAFELYAAVAADTAAASTVAPRALYGAMLVQDAYLENPDSAAVFRDQLAARYPDSPQAYQATAGADADLLAFLLAQEEAALRVVRRDSLAGESGGDLAFPPPQSIDSGLRRRQVYLQRRPPVIYPPPETALAALDQRRAADLARTPEDRGVAVPLAAATGETLSFDQSDVRPMVADSVASAFGDTTAASAAPADTIAPAPAPVDTVAPPPPEPKKEKPRQWDF